MTAVGIPFSGLMHKNTLLDCVESADGRLGLIVPQKLKKEKRQEIAIAVIPSLVSVVQNLLSLIGDYRFARRNAQTLMPCRMAQLRSGPQPGSVLRHLALFRTDLSAAWFRGEPPQRQPVPPEAQRLISVVILEPTDSLKSGPKACSRAGCPSA